MTHFSLIVLIFSFFVFPSSFRFLLFFFFIFFSELFLFQFYSFQVYFKCSMQKKSTWISNFAITSCVCLWIYSITIYFPFAGCICLRNQFLSQNHLRQIWQMVEVLRLVRCPRCLLAIYTRGFATCMINRIKRFYDYQKDRTSDIQPPYPLYHFILVVDCLCRSLLIAFWYSPINHSKRAYPFTGKSL